MSAIRTIALFSLAAAACAKPQLPQGPRPIAPEAGPEASIRVGYSGGLLNRSLTAYFRVDPGAYALVGHLGGDGVIRILWPSTPYGAGWVVGKKSMRTGTYEAPYDGVPSLFSYSMSPYRNLGALSSSYDGRGHGYVFIIAARRPLAYGLLEDDMGQWSEWEVADYSHSSDPRYAIRDFADAVARGRPYTLEYAGSFTTTHYDQVASRAWDCALLSSFGAFGNAFMWSAMNYYSPVAGLLRFSPSSYCGYDYHAQMRYAWLTRGRSETPPPTTVIVPTKPTPGEPAPTLDRPGRRGLGPGVPTTTRNTITRVETGGAESGASRSRPTYGSGRTRTAGTTGRRIDDPVSSPRDHGRGRETSSTGSSTSTGSTGSSTGSSSTGSSGSSRGESRGVTNPREARSGRPDTP